MSPARRLKLCKCRKRFVVNPIGFVSFNIILLLVHMQWVSRCQVNPIAQCSILTLLLRFVSMHCVYHNDKIKEPRLHKDRHTRHVFIYTRLRNNQTSEVHTTYAADHTTHTIDTHKAFVMGLLCVGMNVGLGIPDAEHHCLFDQPLAVVTMLRATLAEWGRSATGMVLLDCFVWVVVCHPLPSETTGMGCLLVLRMQILKVNNMIFYVRQPHWTDFVAGV